MVAASTLVGLMIAPRWGNAPVVLLYLPPVLGAAILRGRWPALVASIASTLAYNFFFTAPYRTLVIHSPADMLTVVILFLVALVTSHLAGSMRAQARLARAHAARNATIAGLARRLLSCTNEQDIAEVAVHELSQLFTCNVVVISGPDDPKLIASAPAQMTLTPGDMAAAAMTLDTGCPSGRGIRLVNLADWQFHPVASDHTVMAAVGLARDDGMLPVEESQVPLLANLLDQVALAVERARLERQAREFVALRERDRIRAALLASIGEDVKPRLTAITSAVRALRRGSSDKALVAAVASEASKLDRYIDNLLDLSPGSDRKPIELGPVTIDLYRRSVYKDGKEVHLTPKEYAVLAELAKHAGRVLTHAHLLRTVWGPAQERQIDYLRVAVRSLRQKLEGDPAHPELIRNEPAVGYRLVAL
jgi:two-component system, OmpR family, sensor histidine kinase KdpD